MQVDKHQYLHGGTLCFFCPTCLRNPKQVEEVLRKHCLFLMFEGAKTLFNCIYANESRARLLKLYKYV